MGDLVVNLGIVAQQRNQREIYTQSIEMINIAGIYEGTIGIDTHF